MKSSHTLREYGGWVLVAHTYTSSYLGGKDQEDHGSKPAWVKERERENGEMGPVFVYHLQSLLFDPHHHKEKRIN
jgi:hypothetical protein